MTWVLILLILGGSGGKSADHVFFGSEAECAGARDAVLLAAEKYIGFGLIPLVAVCAPTGTAK